MLEQVAVDTGTGRKFFLDQPSDLRLDEQVTFVLNLHGGGSHGRWQRLYFPAFEWVDEHRLVIATPSAATRDPITHWVGDADDAHLHHIVDHVVEMFGPQRIAAFWLVGHSQGGMTSNRLLLTDYFASRVDGWLSLSGGRIGPVELPPNFLPRKEGEVTPISSTPAPKSRRPRAGAASLPNTDLSFIFATGEREVVALPETSPWADKYGAGPRIRLPDVIDEEPGRIHDTTREGRSTPGWGFAARPGTAQVYVYPNARGGRVIADIVRVDKGHTEGLEPRITRKIVEMMVAAPGGKLRGLFGRERQERAG